MEPFKKTRFIIYSHLLFVAVCEFVFALMVPLLGGFPELDQFLLIYGFTAMTLAILQMIWIAVLLAFNNRPNSMSILSRTSTHVYSFVVLSAVSAALFFPFLYPLRTQCDMNRHSDGLAGIWCAMLVLELVCCATLAILAASTALLIYRTALNMPVPLKHANITQLDRVHASPSQAAEEGRNGGDTDSFTSRTVVESDAGSIKKGRK
ncbi:hypothetical protein BXZ70DRAFT_1010290 [Cristinia sonorae]|uniref:Uncharacterized protein n=1 Tax=Cristinia sonorae TaxID=1940300 RepID=A0A8K0UJ32_9AGAR|nr:hypothetical protein BXZ70DRAFT_1010290 [Cristinia sonorae]